MNKNIIILFLGIIILAVSACVPPSQEVIEGDILLAKVYNKPLYLSELDGMIPRTASASDSTLIVNAFTDRWVKENLMLYEAERNMPKDLDIDELVRDYRASLILHNYEKQVSESELDSVITNEELMEYYNNYKSHFQLETSIKRCRFIKLSENAPNLDNVEEWWDSEEEEDWSTLTEYCKKNAIVYQLEDSIWLTNTELEVDFPKSIISSLKEGTKLEKEKDGYAYFIEVMEIQSKNTDPPVAYIRTHASNFILHNRKVGLIDKKREELFQDAERKGHVKYFN